MKTILISEVFGPVLQGEGALLGRPTVFVRTGGCDYKCAWCDSLYAVLPQHKNEWQPMEAGAILQEVERLSWGKPTLITLSGGNPALQPLQPLLELGRARGHSFALETQGSVAKEWFALLDYLVLSPKGPSSGMTTDWDKVRACLQAAAAQTQVSLKIVVFDEADYLFAREAAQRFPNVPLFLQAGTTPPPAGKTLNAANAVDVDAADANDMADIARHAAARLEWILRRVTQDGWNSVTVLPQMHVLLYGHKRGV